MFWSAYWLASVVSISKLRGTIPILRSDSSLSEKLFLLMSQSKVLSFVIAFSSYAVRQFALLYLLSVLETYCFLKLLSSVPAHGSASANSQSLPAKFFSKLPGRYVVLSCFLLYAQMIGSVTCRNCDPIH